MIARYPVASVTAEKQVVAAIDASVTGGLAGADVTAYLKAMAALAGLVSGSG